LRRAAKATTACGAQYGLIFNDTYGASRVVPFQTATVEAAQAAYNALEDDGVYMANVLARPDSALFAAIYGALAKVFPVVLIYPVGQNDGGPQNIVLFALKDAAADRNDATGLLRLLQYRPAENESVIPQGIPPLADEYAPVERLTVEMKE
jgi:spermidine synthase